MLILTGFASARPCPAGDAADVFRHRGWEGCVRLRNAHTTVVIAPAVGARVVEFALDGKNVLYVNPALDGKTLKPDEEWMPFDGSQPDTISPAGGRQVRPVWMHPYRVEEATDLSLQCASGESRVAGIREEKRFDLDPRRPLLTLRRRIFNTGDKPARWAFWERTLLPAGATGVAPTNPASRFASGWAADDGKGRWSVGGEREHNPRVVDGALVVHAAGPGRKVGLDSAEGRAAAAVNGLLFTVRFDARPNVPPAGRPEDGVNNIFFFAADRLECESVSPYFEIAPGKAAEWVVTWSLSPLGGAADDDAALVRRVKAAAEDDGVTR